VNLLDVAECRDWEAAHIDGKAFVGGAFEVGIRASFEGLSLSSDEVFVGRAK
jgi:hypothetical protein